MGRVFILILGCLAIMAGSVIAQEVTITDFPIGVGGSVEAKMFRPYYPQLRELADSLALDPSLVAVVTGGADGTEYRRDHDAKNPGLALGRAHRLRSLLVNRFDVDPARITIQSQESREPGEAFRFAQVRIMVETPDLSDRVEALEQRPPVERHFTEVNQVPNEFIENLGLRISAGLTTSPFGAIPTLAGAVTWKRRVFVEGVFGHTAWKDTYRFMDTELETRRRCAGVLMSYFPSPDLPVGAVAGWARIEEIAQSYYDYVGMSEGPLIGLRYMPLDYLTVSALWHPARYREAQNVRSEVKNGQFLFSVAVSKTFGGGK